MAITGTLTESFELGPIRPPSEAFSLLIRVTRNCPWNRCKFCPIYKGEKFLLRTVEEIKQDIRTVRVIQDRIKELARKSGLGDSLREVAAIVCNNPPNDAYRNVALWLYAGGQSAFLQDANTLIMKTGELVEVAEPSTLVQRSLLRVEVRFQQPVEVHRLEKVEGVRTLTQDGGMVVRMEVEGEMDALVKALAEFPVSRIETELPSLEEVFLIYYR